MKYDLYDIDKIIELNKIIYKKIYITSSLLFVHIIFFVFTLYTNSIFALYCITAIVILGTVLVPILNNKFYEFKINRRIIKSIPIIEINNDYSLNIAQNSETICIDNITSIVYSKRNFFHISCDIKAGDVQFNNYKYYFSTHMIDIDSFIKILEFNKSITEMKSYKNFLTKTILNINDSSKTNLFLNEIVTSKFFVPFKLNNHYINNYTGEKYDLYTDSNLQIYIYTSYDEYINKFKNYDKLILLNFNELVNLYNKYRNSFLTEELYIIINKDTENFKFEFKYLQELSNLLEVKYGNNWN